MRQGISRRNLLSFFGWALLLIITLSLPFLFDYPWWTVLVAAIPFITKLAYEHFDNFNLFANRIFLWATNKEVSWEMKAHFGGDFFESDLENIIQTIQNKSRSVQLLQQGDSEKTITIPNLGLVIKIFLANVPAERDEATKELVLDVQRMIVPFRTSTAILNELISLIDTVCKDLEFESEKYSFAAVFMESNPYLGLFLRRLKVSTSARLDIVYNESEGANAGRVVVTKDKVSLVTRDLPSLQAFSKKYVTLSSLNLSSS